MSSSNPPTKITVNESLFKDAMKTGRYEYWTPFFDGQMVGESGILTEQHVNIEVEIICLDIKRSTDGFWTAIWGVVSGPIEL